MTVIVGWKTCSFTSCLYNSLDKDSSFSPKFNKTEVSDTKIGETRYMSTGVLSWSMIR